MVCWASDSSNSILRISAVRVWIFGSSLLLLEEVKGHSLNPLVPTSVHEHTVWSWCVSQMCVLTSAARIFLEALTSECVKCVYDACQPNPENHLSFQPVILASVLVPPVPCHVMRPLVPHGAVSTVPSAFQNGIH